MSYKQVLDETQSESTFEVEGRISILLTSFQVGPHWQLAIVAPQGEIIPVHYFDCSEEFAIEVGKTKMMLSAGNVGARAYVAPIPQHVEIRKPKRWWKPWAR